MKNSDLFRAGLIGALVFPVIVFAGTRDDIEELQIAQQDMQSRLAKMESGMQNKGLLEMAQILERVQTELRELRGMVEQQEHELDGIRKRQRELYLDIDRRLNDMHLQGSVDAGVPAASATPPGMTATTDTATAPAEGNDQQREEYMSAFAELKDAQYDQAIKAFNAFLKKYPSGKYSDNAQYWLGEAHYVSRNFDKALQEFGKVLTQYPRSSKVPDAKLKMGYTYYELKEWDKARQILSEIVNMHANTSVAPLAQQRLQRMSQEGH